MVVFSGAVILFFLSSTSPAQSSADTSNCGETFSTRMDQNVFPKHRFRSRVIKSLPIIRQLECHINCMKNCRCLSYNICNKGKICELNSEKKENNASLYEQNDECDYHEYEFSKKSSSADCQDPCCSTSSPCLNGGRCRASCMKNKKRFRCLDCHDGYGGERCEILARSCASYAKSSDKTPGLRTILAADKNISVFCHFSSKFAMTLVMSFSRERNNAYKPKTLKTDFPRSEDAQNWDDYRLSLATMASIRDAGSTHWIYTCAYPDRGLSEVDYLRSKFSETDILSFKGATATRCTEKLEYVNIRGHSCQDCSVWIRQTSDGIFCVTGEDTSCGGLTGLSLITCQDGTPVNYFGRYNCYTIKHSCTKELSATTQLWFARFIG